MRLLLDGEEGGGGGGATSDGAAVGCPSFWGEPLGADSTGEHLGGWYTTADGDRVGSPDENGEVEGLVAKFPWVSTEKLNVLQDRQVAAMVLLEFSSDEMALR